MKYPAIYQSTVNGNAILLFSDKQGVVLDKHETVIGTSCGWIESAFKNITTEYLANTYGEVKSKAHAEFIVKLAENHGYTLTGEVDKSNARTFVIDGENKLLFFMRGSSSFGGSTVKKITIPLPPELNVNTPEEDFEMKQVAKNNGDNLLFGGDDKCKEWPKVGSSVEWGHTGKGEIKSLSDGFAWIKLDNKDYTTVYVSSLRKPKTPEQELRDELKEIIHTAMTNNFGF